MTISEKVFGIFATLGVISDQNTWINMKSLINTLLFSERRTYIAELTRNGILDIVLASVH